jgi:hypothetical protein
LVATDGLGDPILPTGSSSFTITNPGGAIGSGYCIDASQTFYVIWDSTLTTGLSGPTGSGTGGYRIYDAPCSSNGSC